jgi:hypothetical protein
MTLGTPKRHITAGWRVGTENKKAPAIAKSGRCAFWVPLAGSWGLDYGACTNPASPFDRRAQFEHDGCDEFAQAAEWGSPDDPELNLS